MRWALLGLLVVGCARPVPDRPRTPLLGTEARVRAREVEVARQALPKPDPANRRARDLIVDRSLDGQLVTVDLVEMFWDDGHSTGAPVGGYQIDVTDLGRDVRLRPARPGEGASGEFLHRLAPGLRPPIRVRGRVVHAADGVDLVPQSIEPLSFPTPTRLPKTDDLFKRPAEWAGKYVVIETVHRSGFEMSFLGDGVWLNTYPSAKVRCPPPERARTMDLTVVEERVRVIGYAYTGSHFGHLGMAEATIEATEIVYLDSARCR